ncbi:hypothetical protein EV649_5995 [Kribbella sp. VKM Ac-2569]|uniref:cell division protein FtsK n=1 Tax=Kribbella sp. VKM Ac-2569 TaxID=2512220 RepID=UPI0010E1CEEC|nr:cell division protein FtsK [Kribbella sp. VKM Ac-2569]RZT15209.1 hypothetical protein EV649_5995 [Kribbella sp. VKM Ac-2569]
MTEPMSSQNNELADPIDLDAHRARRDDAQGPEDLAGAPVPVSPAEVERMDTAYEIALDGDTDDPATGNVLVPVDKPSLPVPVQSGERLPIVPVHLRPKALPATMRRAGGRAGHVTAFHAVRSPWYATKFLWFAGRGLSRLIGAQVRWWWVPNSFALEQKAADENALKEWERIHRQLKATRLWRGGVLAVQNIAVTVGALVGLNMAPAAAVAAVLAGLTAVLAHYGRPAGKSLVGTAVVAPRYRKLNSDIVLRAYYAAGLGKPDKPGDEVRFGSTMSRDARNTGTQVTIDLGYGRTWSQVLNAREKIASGLDVHVNQVYLTPNKTSTRRHTLFVADVDPLTIPAGRTDMLDCKPRSVWKPMRFGKDERDALVLLDLPWSSIMVGAQPRMGKTFSARLIALYCALDPYVRLIVADGKKSSDWLAFRLVAHRYIVGDYPNPLDDNPIEHLIATLDEVLAHIDKVNTILQSLPVSECPEGKLTPELARDPRYPDLRVTVMIMEEFQIYFETEDQEANKKIAQKLSRIQATGPSAGVWLVDSTQKPSGIGAGDVQRLFNRYRDNHSVRFALKCGNRDVSMAVLGGDAYAEGYDASSLPVGPEYKGVGFLYGAANDTPTVRTFLADHEDAEKILKAARKHREHAGSLTGEAAGEEIERSTRDVLADMLTVLGADTAAHWEAIAGRLAEQMPEQYEGTTAEAISAQARALHVDSRDVKRDGVVRKGCRAVDVRAAMGRRDGTSR